MMYLAPPPSGGRRHRFAVGAAAAAPPVLIGLVAMIYLSLGSLFGTRSSARPDADVLRVWDGMDLTVGLVNVRNDAGESLGAGVVLTPTGSILTSYVAIRGERSIWIADPATRRMWEADVVGTDLETDVAVLQLRAAPVLAAAPRGTSAFVEVGDPVICVNPTGDLNGLQRTPTVIRDLRRSVAVAGAPPGAEQRHNQFLLGQKLQDGQATCALLDAGGRLVGLGVGLLIDDDGLPLGGSAAAPIDLALSSVERIKAGRGDGSITIGVPTSIGVKVEDGADGPWVVSLETGTSAVELGIHETNVVLAVDGAPVTDRAGFEGAVRAHRPGDAVSITWRDGAGEVHTGTATAIPGAPD